MGRSGTDLLSRFTRWFDSVQRRRLGIWEFSGDPQCILRLGLGHARASLALSDGTRLERGDPVAIMHLWGERIPTIPEAGPDLAWARATQRAFVHSLGLVAHEVRTDPRLAHVRALGNEVSLSFTQGSVRMLQRVGFDVLEPIEGRGVEDRVRALVSKVWTWLLRHTFNRQSAAGRRPADYETRPVWISREALLARYPEAPSAP